MSFFKYPLFMSRKKKLGALDNLLFLMKKNIKKKCRRCHYPFTKEEMGSQYSIKKNSALYKAELVFPDDFISVCPLCKLELEPGMKHYFNDEELKFIRKIKRWRKTHSKLNKHIGGNKHD